MTPDEANQLFEAMLTNLDGRCGSCTMAFLLHGLGGTKDEDGNITARFSGYEFRYYWDDDKAPHEERLSVTGPDLSLDRGFYE